MTGRVLPSERPEHVIYESKLQNASGSMIMLIKPYSP